jgi:ankyrin repeat protein
VPSSQLKHIFECCKKGNTQQLLDALSDIDIEQTVDERNNDLICIALKHGRWGTFTALVEQNYPFSQRKPALIAACQHRKDNIQGIKLVLKTCMDVDVQDDKMRTALMTSCLLGHVKKVQELIKQGASCYLQDEQGNTALIEAVQSNSKKLVELILQLNPVVNQVNKFNETALIVAVKQKSPTEDIINLLLTAGAEPEMLDNNNKSAWLIAKQKHPKISRLIERHLNDKNQIELPFFSNDYQVPEKTLQTKPVETKPKTTQKVKVQNNQQENISDEVISTKLVSDSTTTPYIYRAEKKIKTNKQEWFHAAKTGNLGGLNRMLLEDIDIDCVDEKGCTALIRASGHSRRAVVSFLLQQKANIELRSHNGSTAMSSSIIGNCRRVAGLLLDNKVNPNGLGPSDYSYATIASAQWNEAMLSILYRNGADIFINNRQQQSLLHIVALAAEFYNNINNAKSTIRFLLDHGMNINGQDVDGNTMLMLLCGIHKPRYKVDDRNIASLVYAAIKFGAAAAITNNAGKSALDAVHHHRLQQTKGVLMNALSWNDQ